VKNKCAPPFRQAEFDIMFNQGISREGLLVDLGEEIGVVNRAGAWYSFGDDMRLGQGRENAKVFLQENEDIAAQIERKVREELGMVPAAASEEETGEKVEVPQEVGASES
jgi:recombination protein RecA